jgi:hypothetical protein
MILYIDTYISETPLAPNRILEDFLRKVQEHSYVYRKQSKLNILKYSIASYVPIKWSKVIIRIDGDHKDEILATEPFIRSCFPDADLQFIRCDTGNKYARELEKIAEGNPWVFFSPNNDHPFIGTQPNIFESLIISAEKAEKKFGGNVSILYSHFTETVNSIKSDNYLYGYTGDFCKIIDEDDCSYTVQFNHESLFSLLIFRAKKLLEMMKKAGNNRVIRPEDLGKHVDYTNHSIQIIPKTEVCRHYDAYMHTSFVMKDFITSSIVPPLFIPDGFFENEIRIKYGYSEYDERYVNINPTKRKYIFDSKDGTDIGIFIKDLPYFWKNRIKTIDINPNFSDSELSSSYLVDEVMNPWRK